MYDRTTCAAAWRLTEWKMLQFSEECINPPRLHSFVIINLRLLIRYIAAWPEDEVCCWAALKPPRTANGQRLRSCTRTTRSRSLSLPRAHARFIYLLFFLCYFEFIYFFALTLDSATVPLATETVLGVVHGCTRPSGKSELWVNLWVVCESEGVSECETYIGGLVMCSLPFWSRAETK